MAKMIPPYIIDGNSSNAERKIFNLIKEGVNDSWVCLHSLGIAKHLKKAESEIDFLLIGPIGLFCIEVKGGRVARNNGLWEFIDRFGRVNKKVEGPFNQASTAVYSLMNTLRTKFSYSSNILFGYGVAFPDFEFDEKSPEWDKEMIFDIRYITIPFANYLVNLAKYWKEKRHNKIGLNQQQINQIVNYLRGDFEMIQSFKDKINEIEESLIRLTENQYKALDRLQYNNRIFIRGTAGTGKTLLAIEKARRMVKQGQKVLFLTYNKLLAAKIKHHLESDSSNIIVESLHSYYYKTICRSPFKEEFLKELGLVRDDNIRFKDIYPKYFTQAVSFVEDKFYDYLIIDEGQDILNFEWISPLDKVLEGGLERGNWCIYYDSNNQGEMYKNYDESFAQLLKEYGAVEYVLDTNCRNTRPITIQTSLLTSFEVETSLIENGDPVEYIFYENELMLKKQIADTVNKLLFQGVSPNDITMLFPYSENKLLLEDIRVSCSFEETTSDNIHYQGSDQCIQYCTVQSFKGLENKIVLYFGAKEIEDDWVNTINYVAMTRAKELLFVFLNQEYKSLIDKKTKEYLIRRLENR